jgi:Secretion system C-terminal sorting domain/Cohesin domain
MKMVYRIFQIAVFASCTLLLGGKFAYADGFEIGDYPLSDPDTIHLSIPKNYLVYADSDVIISQFVTDSLTGALGTITSFHEYILYDPNFLEFIDVRNGTNTPAPNWSINKTFTTPGIFYVTGNASGAALHGPGEILQMLFHVVSQAPTFSTSSFIDSIPVFDPLDPVVISDTGSLLVIDACVPIVSQGTSPTSSIMQCSPNPSHGETNLSYFIADDLTTAPDQVQFQLYNSVGNLVCARVDIGGTPGWHSLSLNVSYLSDGVYALEFQAGSTRQIQRLIIMH